MLAIKNIFKPLFLAVVTIFIFTNLAYGQDIWNRVEKDNRLIHTPVNIKQGLIYKVTIYKPFNLKDRSLKEEILSKAKELQPSLGEALYEWKHVIKERDKTLWTNNRFTDKDGNKLKVAYVGGFLENGKVAIYQVIHSPYSLENIYELNKFGTQAHLDKLLKDSGIVFVDKISSENRTITNNKIDKNKIKKPTYKELVRTEPNKGVKPEDIEALINHYNSRNNSNNVYLLLKDGSIYYGLKIPPSDFNVTISKKLQPKRWSKWREIKPGKYQRYSLDEWKNIIGYKLNRTKPNQRYNFTFKSIQGHSSDDFGISYSVSVKTNYLTLKDNGRFKKSSIFKHSSSDAAGIAMTSSSIKGESGGEIVSTPGGSKKYSTGKDIGLDAVGNYKIDGYTIEFKFDSKRVVRELFWENRGKKDNKPYLYIGNKLFYVND